MALTGIQIFKLLPKTNCKECGVPTCLAFAMNLASGKAELDSCPYVSDEAREKLAEASAPPIRPVVLGAGVSKTTVGGETVLYRHEKTFFNPTALAALARQAGLPEGARVGSSSLRRRAQLRARRPDLQVVEFRGNVQTRLAKLESGVAACTFLAMAGLNRLGMSEVATSAIETRPISGRPKRA